MSLYNQLLGFNEHAAAVLAILNIDTQKVARFRDAFFGPESMVVRTRTGGNNRESYINSITYLTSLDSYLEDEDVDFDPTFADFHFKYPEGMLEKIKERMPEAIVTKTFKEQWEEAIGNITLGKNGGV